MPKDRMAMNKAHPNGYYVAPPNPWPPLAAAGAFLVLGGFGLWLHRSGPLVSAIGAAVVVFVAFRWFGTVIGKTAPASITPPPTAPSAMA